MLRGVHLHLYSFCGVQFLVWELVTAGFGAAKVWEGTLVCSKETQESMTCLLRAWFAASLMWWQYVVTSAASSSVVLAPLQVLCDVYRPTQ